jgi:hypothetical protein
LLGTGEESISRISEAAGHTRVRGEVIRFVDLCATRNAAADIFDRLRRDMSVDDRKAWIEKTCVALRVGCSAHHGVAFEHFIRRAINERATIGESLATLSKRFTRMVARETDEQYVRHLAKSFGHIAAAGTLAVRFGTLPWSEKLVRSCIRRCYLDARRELRTDSELLDDGLGILRDMIKTKLIRLSKKKQYRAVDWDQVDGYREKSKGGAKVTVRGEVFKNWFVDPRQLALVLGWLSLKNALRSNRNPISHAQPAVTHAESQPTWPDARRRRSIVFTLSLDFLDGRKE